MAGEIKPMGVSGMSLDERNSWRLKAVQDQVKSAQKTGEKGDNSAISGAQHKKMEEAASQFEALLLHQMIKSMWATVPKDGLFSGGHEQEMFQDMYQESLAEDIANGKGMGIKDILMKEFMKHGK